MQNIRREHIAAFAAYSSFFLILSFFPMIFLIITLIKISGNNGEKFINILYNILPYINRGYINAIFSDFKFRPASVISVSTFITAWSAGKSFYALSEGFQKISAVCEKQNYFFLRLRFLFFSFCFAALIALLFIIGVFGSRIHLIFTHKLFVSVLQKIFVLFAIFVVISLLYIFLPNNLSPKQKHNIKKTLISSAASSFVIFVYTNIFSLFAGIYIKHSTFYGGIATFITAMLWIYGSMYIILLGYRFLMYLFKNK